MEHFGKCMSSFDSEVRRNPLDREVLNGLFSLAPPYVTPLWLIFGCLKLFTRRGRDSEGKKCNDFNFVRYVQEMVFCSERTHLHTSPENKGIKESLPSELLFLWDEELSEISG